MDTTLIEISSGAKKAQASCTTFTWSKKDALQKATRALGFCWLFALITIFIPMVHFVTVPLGILFGPILAWIIFRMYNNRQEWDCKEAPCPECQKASAIRWAKEVTEATRSCPHCKSQWSVRLGKQN